MVIWLWGEPRSGKSTWVTDHFMDTDDFPTFWADDDKEGWLGDYQDQETIVFNEFRGLMPLQKMLKLVDHAPLNYTKIKNIKQRPMLATTFVFTSNHEPAHYYDDTAWLARTAEPWFHIFRLRRHPRFAEDGITTGPNPTDLAKLNEWKASLVAEAGVEPSDTEQDEGDASMELAMELAAREAAEDIGLDLGYPADHEFV